MSDQPPPPKRIAWFAPWTWKRRWWTVTGLLLFVIGGTACLVLLLSSVLFPTDIYIHDTYIKVPSLF